MDRDEHSAGEGEDQLVWSARLGGHLEAARVRAGMRRVDLAARMGVSEETIRLWEKGSVQPTPERLARLIAMLSIEASLWQIQDAAPAPELPVLARRLREERELLGLTQAAVGTRLGIPQATYAAWETGRTTPAEQHHAALASFLGMTVARVAELCEAPFVVDFAAWPPLGRIIGERRQALRMTRADLADRLDVSARTITSWELGYRTPQAQQLVALAGALSVSAVRLTEALPRRAAASRLGELILERQRALGLRSADVARLVGTTESTLSRWINGHTTPVKKNLERLAEALSIPRPALDEALGVST